MRSTHLRSLAAAIAVLGMGLVWAGSSLSAGWEVRRRIPYHVYGHAGAAVDRKLHVLGGCHTPNWQIPCRYHQVYDPARDAWTLAEPLPLAIGWAMPAVHRGKIYLFGGGYYRPPQGITSTAKSWVFDPAPNRWSTIRDLPVPIMNGFAVAVGDFIYVGLGYDRRGGEDKDIVDHYLNTYRYDPAQDSYERMADAPELGCYATVGQWQNRVYIVAGAHIEIGFHSLEEYQWADGALKYDPAVNRWTRINAPRIKKRVFYLTQCTSSAVFGPRLFAVGGMGEYRDRTTAAEYLDMEQEIFREIPPILEPRCCGGGAVVDNLLVLAGGFFGVAEDLGAVCEPIWVLDVGDLPDVMDLNLAKHQPAAADSETEGHQAVRACDGNLDTFWEPDGSAATNRWWRLDLREVREFATCKLTWHSAIPAVAYTLETSADGVDWTAVAARAPQQPTPRVEVWELRGVKARLLRLRFAAVADPKQLSLREVELFP